MPTKLKNEEILKWDIVTWEAALIYWERELPNNLNGFRALELGSSCGGLSAWLAQKGAEVIASDIAPLQDEANALHKRYNLAIRIRHQIVDATMIPYENEFDIIIFKSIVGRIGSNNNICRQRILFEQIHKALKPSGKLLFAENKKSSPLHQWARKKFMKWGESWSYITHSDMKFFLRHYNKFNLVSGGFISPIGRSKSQRNFLGYVDRHFLNHIVPKSWHYIIYGIAQK